MAVKTYSQEQSAKAENVRKLKELMDYGKKFAITAEHQTEEELADYITEERRKREPWRQKLQGRTRR